MVTFKEISEAMADAVETAGASLVTVEARRRQSATGIIFSADGIIVTAHHVVERDEEIHVILPDGERVEAKLIGRDPHNDLAV
ncbi:MAG: trypsin-like peptidase domain-containing protein, partial [Aggregatilineales bacterium]